MSKPPFKVEAAKSGRSKCCECKNPIAQESTRIGKLERSDKFDGEVHMFHTKYLKLKR